MKPGAGARPSFSSGWQAVALRLAAVFGDACTDCHSTDAWSPARFDRQHTFPVDHGESGVSSCQTCHPTQVQAYTCYGCHEHDPAVIEREHLDEGISDFLNCMECHPTGQEEDGEGGGGGDD